MKNIYEFISEQGGELMLHDDILTIDLSNSVSIIEVLKVGTIQDRGLKISKEMLDDFVKNFESGTYGSDIQVNLGHVREGEAAGWVKRLFVNDDKLLAEVEWTPLGVEKIQTKQFRYTSSELALSLPHPQNGEKVKNVLIGIALTNIPAVKGLAPISLSEKLQLQLNQDSTMKNCKEVYNALMKKDEVTAKDMEEFNAAAKDHAEPDGDEVSGMREKLKEKMPGKKAEKASDSNEPTVSLSEFNTMKAEMEQLKEKAKESEALKEELRMTKLNEIADSQLILSNETNIGFPPDSKEKVMDFIKTLSQTQLEAFVELHKLQASFIAGKIGTDVNIAKATEKLNEDKVLAELNKEAADRFAKNPEKELHVHLSDLIKEKGLDNL